ICPMIESAEQAWAFVRSCCYPPRGARSFGPIRARLVYGDGDAATANDDVMPFAMIETAEALARVEEILDVEGLAGVYIGPADLAFSL
ncbi:aldolase/citrate lyase family protein, partial [Acinetobacter baumannii]